MTNSKFIKDQSVAKNLFLGSVQTENLFPYSELPAEQNELIGMVIDSVNKFMEGKEKQFSEFDVKAHQSPEFINELKELGLFGLIIPEEYAGIGLNSRGYSRIVQQVGKFDASTALTIGAHSSIGMRGVLLYGNELQKKKYLPKLASGEMLAAFCLTEAGAGSDAASIKTHAVKNTDGSWSLTGEKIWITNGPFADFFTVFAKTESGEAGKMSAFLVERSWPGISTGPKEDKMGIRASATSTVIFSNVQVPAENLLGEEGKGFKVAMDILNNGRTGLGGGCVGAMKKCLELAIQQSTSRKQFGQKISDFQLIKEKITQITLNTFASESLVNYVAYLIDSGSEDYSVEAAISKIYSTEALWNSVYESLQIAGGNGFMREFPYERIVRDSRINMIFEGTNEILRLYVALSGYKHAGTYLKEVGAAAANAFNDPIKGFGIMKNYAAKKLTEIANINAQTLAVEAPLKEVSEIIVRYVIAFSGSIEILLKKYKKEMIGKQIQSKRIADIAIDLLTSLAIISRVNSLILKNGAGNSSREIAIANLFVAQAKRRMNQNMRRLDHNEDKLSDELADKILEDGYIWDVI